MKRSVIGLFGILMILKQTHNYEIFILIMTIEVDKYILR